MQDRTHFQEYYVFAQPAGEAEDPSILEGWVLKTIWPEGLWRMQESYFSEAIEPS